MAMTGRCLCGAISYRIEGEPAMALACHCKNCQRQAGTALSTIIGVPAAMVAVEGTPRMFLDKGDSGGDVERHFCSTCGSPLYSRVAAAADMIFIKAGTLDDTSGFAPQMHVWTQSAQDWFDPGDVPAFATLPGAPGP
ncbi:MAG: GFA family protein [Pseudomonadota bacterium]